MSRETNCTLGLRLIQLRLEKRQDYDRPSRCHVISCILSHQISDRTPAQLLGKRFRRFFNELHQTVRLFIHTLVCSETKDKWQLLINITYEV